MNQYYKVLKVYYKVMKLQIIAEKTNILVTPSNKNDNTDDLELTEENKVVK